MITDKEKKKRSTEEVRYQTLCNETRDDQQANKEREKKDIRTGYKYYYEKEGRKGREGGGEDKAGKHIDWRGSDDVEANNRRERGNNRRGETIIRERRRRRTRGRRKTTRRY